MLPGQEHPTLLVITEGNGGSEVQCAYDCYTRYAGSCETYWWLGHKAGLDSHNCVLGHSKSPFW